MLRLLSCMLLITTFFACFGSGISGKETANEQVVINDELASLATKWKGDIIRKDVDGLTSFLLPEAKQKAKTDLLDPQSSLYKIFYDNDWNRKEGRKSVANILKQATDLKIVLVEHTNLRAHGNGITVYYFDQDKISPNFPLSSMEKQSLTAKGDIWSLFFFQVEGSWYTSYNFFE